MSKFDELKGKAMATLGTIINKSSDIYEAAEEKAKLFAKSAKLKAEIAKDNAEIKKLYTDLGSLYYCLNKDNPDDALKQLCEEITSLFDKIEIRQNELEAIAAEAAKNDIVVDISEETDEPETEVETAEEVVNEEEISE